MSRHLWRLICCLPFLFVAGCKGVTTVNPDAAEPFAASFWQSLQANDVSKAIDMYDPSLWRSDPDARSRWSGFLGDLGQRNGAVGFTELKGKKWFPGSELVADHRAFVCYAYDYEVRRPGLSSQERLVICGEPRAPTSAMRIYGHALKRLDTQQSVRIGIDVTEKAL